ncbi:UNVERIFIED_CONTAM: hypothetical protein PYX00_011110 [Menopon gallinae]|uniref:DNA/pantothenate metabolism flavoprotein C-terminal domain-containing protein n=1 Tax=Menopon gallinae TaxID=328185 RepID=A0AAW2H670_9NEOP
MGYALAQIAAFLGGNVTLVSGPSNLSKPFNCDIIKVKSAEEMEKATLKLSQNADIVVMAAAVADFKPLDKYTTWGKAR